MKYIKLLALSLMLLVSYSLGGLVQESSASPSVTPGDQFIAYYNTSEASATVIQLSNVDFVNGVNVHVQILDETCEEVNFPHTLTPGDTDVLALEFDTVFLDGVPLETVLVTPTQGIVIVTAVESFGSLVPADSNDSLIGTSWIVGVAGEPISHQFGAVHRSINANGQFDLIQPTDILSPFWEFDGFGSEFVAAAWTDVYPGGQYIATTGSAATDPLLGLNIFDDNEAPVSCLNFSFECVIAAGVTVALPSTLDTPGDAVVCDKSLETHGLVDLNDLVVTDNLIVLQGMFNDFEEQFQNGGMDYAITTTAQEVVPPPVDCEAIDPCSDLDNCTPECQDETCTNLASCETDAELCEGIEVVLGAVCDGEGGATEIACADGFDNNVNTLLDCEDPDCADLEVCDTGGTGGGSSSGCSVATATTGLGSMANALVLLIPAFGIGVRRIRRRLSK